MFIEIALAVAVGIVLGLLILCYWEPLAIAAVCIGAACRCNLIAPEEGCE